RKSICNVMARLATFHIKSRIFTPAGSRAAIPHKRQKLLLYSENRVLSGFGDSEFNHDLGWNSDLLLRLWIKPRTRLPLLFYQLAKSWQNEFAVPFDLFVREAGELIEEYSGDLLIRLGRFGKSELKFCFGHLLTVMAAAANDFKEKTRVASECQQD